MPLLLDTGAIYALAHAEDVWHQRMRGFLEAEHQTLLTPAPVVSEAAYLFRSRLGVRLERQFVHSLAQGEIAIENLRQPDLARCVQLLDQYDFLGFVDASLVAIAERLKLKALVTTDRRDFGRVRPRHISHFDLLP